MGRHGHRRPRPVGNRGRGGLPGRVRRRPPTDRRALGRGQPDAARLRPVLLAPQVRVRVVRTRRRGGGSLGDPLPRGGGGGGAVVVGGHRRGDPHRSQRNRAGGHQGLRRRGVPPPLQPRTGSATAHARRRRQPCEGRRREMAHPRRTWALPQRQGHQPSLRCPPARRPHPRARRGMGAVVRGPRRGRRYPRPRPQAVLQAAGPDRAVHGRQGRVVVGGGTRRRPQHAATQGPNGRRPHVGGALAAGGGQGRVRPRGLRRSPRSGRASLSPRPRGRTSRPVCPRPRV